MEKKKKNNNLVDLGERGRYHLKNKLNNLTGKEWVKFTKSWEIINPRRRKEDSILHPAKYPEELVESFISFFTKKGQIVFDPFLGTGSTLVAAKKIGRYGLGIELVEKYAKIASKRVGEEYNKTQFIINGDASQITGNLSKKINTILIKNGFDAIDFIITSPPYWDMLKKSRGNIKSAKKIHVEKGNDSYYSDRDEDLGNISDYESYMSKLLDIFSQCYTLLKKGGYLVIVIQNIRVPKGHMVPLAWDLAIRLSKKYILKQEKLWLQNNKPLNCWGYPSSYVSNVHHHYCLIFQKQ